jgi:hypothetical protein
VSVENPDVIDVVGVDKQTGHVVLTISDHLGWQSDEHLLRLQEKLNGYLRFIESGELVEQYPQARGLKPQITVVLKYVPNETGVEFLTRVSRVIEDAGIAFRYETLPQ